jgi:hypothetical protein
MRHFAIVLSMLVFFSFHSAFSACTDWMGMDEPLTVESSTRTVKSWGDDLVYIQGGSDLILAEANLDGTLQQIDSISLPYPVNGISICAEHVITHGYEHASLIHLNLTGEMELLFSVESENAAMNSAIWVEPYLIASGYNPGWGWGSSPMTIVFEMIAPNQASYLGYWSEPCLKRVRLAMEDGYVMAAGNCGFQVVNIDNPLDPEILNSVPLDFLMGMEIQDNRVACVGGDGNFVAVIEITNPLQPTLLDVCTTPWGGMWDVGYKFHL